MKVYETLESGIKIVEYEPSLAASIAEMWNLSSDDWGGSSSLKTASQIISEHETASHFNVFIALDGDTAVGYCSFGRYYYDSGTMYIPLLGVRTDYKNKKIGKALVLRCVQRTIELGYPRLDLYTWSGNTAAVPLYKKCGFLWEDRPNSTHLANFMPTILTAPIFAEFFAKADWYADSTREIEIAPDGIEVNNFELFGYSWVKDGENLAVGFERTGRQMRMIETNDYKIELVAQNHELAFGTDYNCTFVIENKTGKELNIKITGREDKNIKLDYALDTQVTGKQEFHTTFYVGETNEVQDAWKIHPCLLADVEINGQSVTFGMGIEAKFPLVVELQRECVVDQVGMTVKTFIDLSSALLEDGEVAIHVPESSLLKIAESNIFTTKISARGKASISTTATTLAIGFEALELDCTATLKSGKTLTFTAPLHIFTKDITHAYSGENLQKYTMCNGPWWLNFSKDDNEVHIKNILNSGYSCGELLPPKFGKPYDDEFNLLKPSVKMYQQDTAMVLEAEFASEKFPGMVVTQVYTLFATGVISRKNRVQNRSDKNQHVMLWDGHWFELGDKTTFSYNGQVMQNCDMSNSDSIIHGLGSLNPDNFDENWVFEASPTNPRGYCWPMDHKPSFKWGSFVSFEIDPGALAPGQVFETQPVVYAYGIFADYNSFRNYARQIFDKEPMIPSNNVDIMVNGYNPFVAAQDIKLEVINNREQILAGDIVVNSGGQTLSQTNPEEEQVERNTFNFQPSLAQNIDLATVRLNTAGYDKTYNKALFFPKGNITRSQDGTVYSISNGAIHFKVDPAYGNVCYSLTDAKNQEWLLNKYPNHEPYSWFNPFLGGIRVGPYDMNNVTILKEKITADFAEVCDNFGNLWQGICVTLDVNEFDKFKGAVYKTYYMTLPGLPVLCTFFRFENGTGQYKDNWVVMGAYFNPDDNFKNVFVETMDKNHRAYRVHMGTESFDDINFQNTAVIKSAREEQLYTFHGNKNNTRLNYFWGNNKIPVTGGTEMQVCAAHGETFTSSPLFLIITDKNLPLDALDDLERVKF